MEDPKAALVALLEQWPSATEKPEDAYRRLGSRLAPSFALADLANVPHVAFDRISRILLVKDRAKALVTESSDPNALNLATLVRSGDAWLLTSFKFQCVTCFGTGVDGDTPCNVCGAEGWGVAEGDLLEDPGSGD